MIIDPLISWTKLCVPIISIVFLWESVFLITLIAIKQYLTADEWL